MEKWKMLSPPFDYIIHMIDSSDWNLTLTVLLEDSNGLDYGVEVIQA